MIFFGTRGVNTTQSEGEFHCPKCGAGQEYRHRSVRRFFSFCNLPLVPLDKMGEFVECLSCKRTYHPDVLNFHPEKYPSDLEAHSHRGARKVMAAMLLADGDIKDEEVKIIHQVYFGLSGHALSEEALRAEIAQMQESGETLADVLSRMRGYLNIEGAEVIVRAGCLVAMADDEYHHTEKELLLEIAQGLGMPPFAFKGILRSLVKGAKRSKSAAK